MRFYVGLDTNGSVFTPGYFASWEEPVCCCVCCTGNLHADWIGDRSIFRRVIVPNSFYSEQSFFWKVFIPNGHFSDTQVYGSSLVRTVFIPKGHCSSRFLFRRITIPKFFYSERSLFRTVIDPNGRYSGSLLRSLRMVFIPKGQCSENSEYWPFGTKTVKKRRPILSPTMHIPLIVLVLCNFIKLHNVSSCYHFKEIGLHYSKW